MAEPSTVELERLWKERCERGEFSAGVLGVGTIKIMGKSGDATLMFPRIATLEVLEELTPDEQYAVRAAQAIVQQAQQNARTVFVVEPEHQPERITEYRPDVESMLVVARVAGG